MQQVSGRVAGATGEPLQGVTVQVKNARLATTTNSAGDFTITAPGNAVLVFSYVGFVTREMRVDNRTSLSVTLDLKQSTVEDVIVVGYGTRRKGDVTGSVASIQNEKIREVPTTNVSQALQGRIPGLVSTPSSFRPGSGSSIRIRGSRSLTAGNDPLVVVDGVPITYSVDDLNPLDIESIDVLKDASATAIYGSRGANGVIQVTTRKGRQGKISMDYDGKVSVDNILKKVDVFSASEFAQLKRDAFIGSRSYNPALSNAATSPRYYFPDPATDYTLFNTRMDASTWASVASAYTWIDQANRIAAKRPTTADEKALLTNLGFTVLDSVAIYDPAKVQGYDWTQNGLQTGITNNHNISVTGGSEKFRASFSGGYFNQKGIETGQDFTRYTFSLNADMRPNKIVNVGGGILYTNSIQNQGASVYSGALGQIPLASPYDSAGNLIFFPGNDANIINPINDVNSVLNEVRVNRVLPNAFAEVRLLKGLKFRAAGNIDASDWRQGRFNGSVSSVRAGTPASASYETRKLLTWVGQTYLTYDERFAEKHSLNVVVGQEFVKNRSETYSVSQDNLIYESQKWYSLQNNNSTTPNNATGSFSETKQWSYFGRANYSYNDKYLLTATVRSDWASVLPEGHKNQTFPSVAIGWRLDKENFMKSLSAVNLLKLKVGYGEVGNTTSINPYLAAGTITRTPYNFGSNPAQGYAPSTLPLDITWERTKSKNIGLEFGTFNNRITGSLDVYETNTNQILSKRLPAAGGIGSILVNLGSVRNRGIELGLSTVNIDRPSGLRWVTDFVFTKNTQAITDLGTGGSDIANQWFIGQPTNIYYDYKKLGVFQYSDTSKGGVLADYFWKKEGNKTNANFQPGRYYVADLNGDTTITESDKMVLGSHNPKWTGSVSSTLTFKNFELNILVYASQGALVRERRPSLNGRYPTFKVDYWTPTNPTNTYAQANNTIDILQYWQAAGFRDGSFVRVRNISLTYRFPQKLIQKAQFTNLSVYVNVLNPFLFSSLKDVDVETIPYLTSYPTSSTAAPGPSSYSFRSFVFGVRVGM